MKTTDYLDSYMKIKQDLKQCVKQIFYGKMVSDNIADLIPKQWKIETDHYRGDIRISPVGEALTADRFDKLLTKLSSALQVEPKKSISKKELHATLTVWMPGYKVYYDLMLAVRIEIIATNSESCEVFTKEVTTIETVTVLSGYCKALADKIYLDAAR
jgi:hypothetical protein